jgi:D-alanyl-D-alanine carboxypeptidase
MKMIYLFLFLMPLVAVNAQVELAAIDKIVTHHIQENNFEGTILIAENGQTVYQKCAGAADHDTGRLIDPQTPFGIASITKMLTAIVILQLVEEGKISLDNTLNELFPDVSIPKSQKISIHHLLLHISGLPNEKSELYLSPTTAKEFVEATLQNKSRSKLGRFNYANIDYVLLGLIIEKYAEESSWKKAIEKRVIQKLGLKNTGFLKKGDLPKQLAQTYQLKEGSFIKDPDFFIENFHAAGAMYSTAADLLVIDQAMYGNTLLSESSKKKMFTSYPEYNYTGYSVWTYQYPFAATKPRIMERRGGILGSNSVLVRFLDANRTIIILSNNNAFNPDSFGDQDNLREALILELSK